MINIFKIFFFALKTVIPFILPHMLSFFSVTGDAFVVVVVIVFLALVDVYCMPVWTANHTLSSSNKMIHYLILYYYLYCMPSTSTSKYSSTPNYTALMSSKKVKLQTKNNTGVYRKKLTSCFDSISVVSDCTLFMHFLGGVGVGYADQCNVCISTN